MGKGKTPKGPTRDEFVVITNNKRDRSGFIPKHDAEFSFSTDNGGYCRYSFYVKYSDFVANEVQYVYCGY